MESTHQCMGVGMVNLITNGTGWGAGTGSGRGNPFGKESCDGVDFLFDSYSVHRLKSNVILIEAYNDN